MFFVVSKLYQMFLSPLPILMLAALLGVILTFGRTARFGRWLAAGALFALIVIGMTPVGFLLAAPLEDRFPLPPADMAPPDGIVILGGAVKSYESKLRGEPIFDEGERVVEAAILARRYPDAKVVFTGGFGMLTLGGNSGVDAEESVEVKKLLVDLGVDPARVTLEAKSRNTDENARFTAALVHPQPGQRWLLITSAFHMPRSMGLFEKAGFDVVAYPVAYRTAGPGLVPFAWTPNVRENFRIFDIAAREWVGLLAYWATGRITHLFPGPQDAPAVAARGA